MGMHMPTDWSFLSPERTRMPALQCRFASLAASLNFIASIFMETGQEWLFLLNDDHVYPPDILIRLLSHNKDFVTGLYLKKQLPFDPILYDKLNEDGNPVPKLLKPYEAGLIPIVACGDGVLLIRRTVLEKIPYPWWEMSSPEAPDLIRQDLIFCKKVREAGIEMFCDLDAGVGHIAIMPIFPQRSDGQWKTVMIAGPDESDKLILPAASQG